METNQLHTSSKPVQSQFKAVNRMGWLVMWNLGWCFWEKNNMRKTIKW